LAKRTWAARRWVRSVPRRRPICPKTVIPAPRRTISGLTVRSVAALYANFVRSGETGFIHFEDDDAPKVVRVPPECQSAFPARVSPARSVVDCAAQKVLQYGIVPARGKKVRLAAEAKADKKAAKKAAKKEKKKGKKGNQDSDDEEAAAKKAKRKAKKAAKKAAAEAEDGDESPKKKKKAKKVKAEAAPEDDEAPKKKKKRKADDDAEEAPKKTKKAKAEAEEEAPKKKKKKSKD
jgi:hypothetical protein